MKLSAPGTGARILPSGAFLFQLDPLRSMSLAPLSGCRILISVASGGLRYAPTTGYYLTALQAVERSASGRLANLFQDFPDLFVMTVLVVTDKRDRGNTIDVA